MNFTESLSEKSALKVRIKIDLQDKESDCIAGSEGNTLWDRCFNKYIKKDTAGFIVGRGLSH